MTLIAVCLALWATLLIAVDTQTGRFLHRAMVKLPALAFNKIRGGHLMVFLILIGFGGVLGWFGGADGLRFFSMAVPNLAIWFTTFEISAYLDAIAAIIAASSILRLNAIRIGFVFPLARMFRRRQAGGVRRGTRRETFTSAANDDDDDGRFALAC